MSRVITAKVRGGVLVADDFARLPDGMSIEVVVPDDEPATLTPEDEEELADRVAEADRGDTLISAEDVLRELRARAGAARR